MTNYATIVAGLELGEIIRFARNLWHLLDEGVTNW